MTAPAPVLAPPGPRISGRRLDIQGLRGVAVLMVVAYHAGLPLPGGFVGVDVFFVISGFVITQQICSAPVSFGHFSFGDFSFGDFYARRIRRLWPALIVMLAATLVASFFLQSPLGDQQRTALTAVGAVLLNGNTAIQATSGGYFAESAATNPLLHVWSLAVEEQFYLLFPLVLLARRSYLVLLTGLSFAAGALLSLHPLVVGGVRGTDIAFYSAPTRAWEFGVGALLALGYGSAKHARWQRVWGLLLLVVAGVCFDSRTAWPGIAAVVPVAGAALIIAAGPSEKGLGWALNRFARVGDLSYSIYLWHWPFIAFATEFWLQPWVPMVAAGCSLVPAWVSYVYVEQRFRRSRAARNDLYTYAFSASAATVGLALVVHTLGLIALPDTKTYAAQRDTLTLGRSLGCLVIGGTYRATDPARCRTSVPGARGWVMLVGDSHADALSSGVAEAARRQGYATMLLTGTQCQFSRIAPTVSRGVVLPDCRPMNDALLRLAAAPADRPALVVLSHRFLTRAPEWPAGLRATLEELHSDRVPVLFALDVPNFGVEQTEPCRGGWLTFTCERSERQILGYQGRSRRAELALATGVPGVSVYDPWPVFCRTGTCSTLLNGQLAYSDDNHLDGIGSRALTESLTTVFSRILPAS